MLKVDQESVPVMPVVRYDISACKVEGNMLSVGVFESDGFFFRRTPFAGLYDKAYIR